MLSSLLQRLGGAQASSNLLEEKVRGIGPTHRLSCAAHSPQPTECARSARHVCGACAQRRYPGAREAAPTATGLQVFRLFLTFVTI